MTNFQKLLLKNVGPYLGAIIILGIALILIGGNISEQTIKISQQRLDLATKTQSIKSLASLRTDYELAKPHFDLLQNILPSKDEMISFLKDLESFARKNQLDFGSSFGSEVVSTASEPGQINFRASIQGSYDGFLNFLKLVDQSRYFVNFSNLELTENINGFNIIVNGKVFSR